MVRLGVTRHPTATWVAQQLREATPFGQRSRYLIRDNDSKYSQSFTRVAEANGIEVPRTASRTAKENALCERFLGSVRRECLDHVLVRSEAHPRCVLRGYVAYFNTGWAHEGLQQRIPGATQVRALRPATAGTVRAVAVPGGLHHLDR